MPPTDPFPKPHWGKRACAIIGAFNGSAAHGARAMEPLLAAVPAPLFNWMGPMPFPAMMVIAGIDPDRKKADALGCGRARPRPDFRLEVSLRECLGPADPGVWPADPRFSGPTRGSSGHRDPGNEHSRVVKFGDPCHAKRLQLGVCGGRAHEVRLRRELDDVLDSAGTTALHLQVHPTRSPVV